MMKITRSQFHKKEISLYFHIMAIVILMSSSVMWNYIDGPFPDQGIYRYIFFLLAAVPLFVVKKLNKKMFKAGIIISVYLLTFIALSGVNPGSYFKSFFFPIFLSWMLFIVDVDNVERIFNAFSDVIYIVACISLFFYFFGSLLGIIPGSHTVRYFWAEHYLNSQTWFYVYFNNIVQNAYFMGHNIYRNVAIFTEAPGYSYVLDIALIIEMILKPYMNKKRVVILMLALVTSFSTKGFVMILVSIFLYLWIKIAHYDKKSSKKIILFMIIVLVSAFGIIIAGNILEMKSAFGQGGSTSVRMDDMFTGLSLWKEHPFIGVGFQNSDAFVRRFKVIRNNDGLSMGLTTLLGMGGVWLGAYFVIPLFLAFSCGKESRRLISACIMMLIELFISNDFSDIMFQVFATGLYVLILQKFRIKRT